MFPLLLKAKVSSERQDELRKRRKTVTEGGVLVQINSCKDRKYGSVVKFE